MHPELIKVIVGRNYFEMERDTVILKMKLRFSFLEGCGFIKSLNSVIQAEHLQSKREAALVPT